MNTSLSQLRTARGWTQTQLSSKAGLRRATISQLESGAGAKPNAGTIGKLAKALGITEDMCSAAIALTVSTAAEQARISRYANETHEETAFRLSGWLFMSDLDRDLASALTRELIVLWTHGSTSLEGNTITLGDTKAILTTGITVSGKSLLEHSEIFGHANAISLMAQVCKRGSLTFGDIHELHQVIQTGVVRDIFSPIGKWKVEPNGTQSSSAIGWHDYAAPAHIPVLMERWLDLFKRSVQAIRAIRTMKTIKKPTADSNSRKKCLDIYTQLHVAFTRIHPYADGNGRLARLLANIPLLVCGLPPLLIDPEKRIEYINLLAENDVKCGTLSVDDALYKKTSTFKNLISFFDTTWETTWTLVEQYRERQKKRDV